MRSLLIGLSLLPTVVLAAPPDLATTAGFTATCQQQPADANALKTNADRQAFSVCHDVALVKKIARWVNEDLKSLDGDKDGERLRQTIRRQLGEVRDDLRSVREVLTRLKLKSGEGLELAPGQWQDDLDGDGKVETWERYFFAIPQRGEHPPRFMAPSNDPDYYAAEYAPEAKFRVDQSDVLWALSYHQFAEGAVETVLAYTLDLKAPGDKIVVLAEPARLKQAHRLIADGMATSRRMLDSVQAEKDDDEEWIANPRQRNSVFPLPLDEGSFKLWRDILAELTPLWQGKTLLAAGEAERRTVRVAGEICPTGQGLDIARLYRQPVRYPLDPRGFIQACRPITAKAPMSGLAKVLADAAAHGEREPDTQLARFLRHLYWVN